MQLQLNNGTLQFLRVPLTRHDGLVTNLFADKNNKTVAETLTHRRYEHLAAPTADKYGQHLHQPLGTFLGELKSHGDPFYRRFLNKYGDLEYCTFSIADHLKSKGLYCFSVDGVLQYIGRSHDPFGKRINQGYGRIHPKNCYLDGQATNCHLNALIASSTGQVQFFACPIEDDTEIDLLERELIRQYLPPWNIALKSYD